LRQLSGAVEMGVIHRYLFGNTLRQRSFYSQRIRIISHVPSPERLAEGPAPGSATTTRRVLLSLDDGLFLIPQFRHETFDLFGNGGVCFTARELSALRDFFHSLLAAW
jgi:hypothetical protein